MTFTDLSEESAPVSGDPHIVSMSGVSERLLVYPADDRAIRSLSTTFKQQMINHWGRL